MFAVSFPVMADPIYRCVTDARDTKSGGCSFEPSPWLDGPIRYGPDAFACWINACDGFAEFLNETQQCNETWTSVMDPPPSITCRCTGNNGGEGNAAVQATQIGTCPGSQVPNPNTGQCEATTVPKELGGSCNSKFNPCNVATGNKYESETDYQSTNGLAFVRHYDSQDNQNRGLGVGWTSNLHRSLELEGTGLMVWQADGRGGPWVNNAGVWTGDPDTNLQLTEDATGYILTMPDNRAERYDLNGKLISETTATGLTTQYAYDTNGRLETVTGPFGHSLTLGYGPTNGWMDTLTDPAGNVYRYGYTTQGSSYVLSEVAYPDETPGDNTDNPKRIYHYEDPNFPDFLTGITDENGDRFSTFACGAGGKAISTEHATGPQEKYQLSY